MDPNTQKALYIGVAILFAICCLISSIVGGYYAYQSSTATTPSTGAGGSGGTPPPPPPPTLPTKPTGFNTITAPSEYGCPPQTFTKTSPNAAGDAVWLGNAAGDNVRNLVFDPTQNKLYCCRDPNNCNFAKGGWFYGWDINDSRLTYT